MKVAITGHTKGIGAAISDRLLIDGHEILGFSRSTGYTLYEDTSRVVADAMNADVFINNVKGMGQVELLYQMFAVWHGQDKRIINIGSRAGTYANQSRVDRYSIEKQALDTAVNQLVSAHRPRVSVIKPGYVDTDSVRNVNRAKLEPSTIADVVVWMLTQPPEVHISCINLNHVDD